MKKIIPLLLLPVVSFADFDADDKTRLTHIASDVNNIQTALTSNGSFTINPLQSIQYLYRDFTTAFLTSSSSWGGHFIKTVGNAAAKFTQEFGSSGWFPAVKASIGVIQADVGRINTSLTDVNTHLEVLEPKVEEIRDTLDSMNDTVESIDSTVSAISNDTSSIKDNIILLKDYLNPDEVWADGADGFAVGFNIKKFAPDWFEPITKDNFLDVFVSVNQSGSDNWASRVEQWLQAICTINGASNEMIANMLLRESIIQYTEIASTNLLQKILDTNDVWYAKIYDRIPTNLTVVVSNIASNASNDWHYTAATTLSSSPVLQNLAPDISRDVSQSYSLPPPTLTGDFKQDVILLLAHAQQVAASGSSVNLDILTNLQVVASSILSAKERVDNAVSDQQQRNQQIIDDGTAHEHDLDSIEHVFDLGSNNTSIHDASTRLSEIPSKLGDLNVSTAPSSGTLTIPAFSFGGYELHELQVNVDYSEYQPYFDAVRRVFALFWFGFVVYLLLLFLKFGIQFLGRIAAYIDPRPFLNNVQVANALTV